MARAVLWDGFHPVVGVGLRGGALGPFFPVVGSGLYKAVFTLPPGLRIGTFFPAVVWGGFPCCGLGTAGRALGRFSPCRRFGTADIRRAAAGGRRKKQHSFF